MPGHSGQRRHGGCAGGACDEQHGFVPATTLNISGTRNADNLLLDAWGAPVRYSVSAADVNGDGIWDYTNPGQLATVSMPLAAPDLVVCSTAAGASSTDCASVAVTIAAASPAVVYSLGKDWTQFGSADQLENVGANLGGGASGRSYPVAADAVFVSRGRSDRSGEEFDDQLLWLSGPTLFRTLVSAGHLP